MRGSGWHPRDDFTVASGWKISPKLATGLCVGMLTAGLVASLVGAGNGAAIGLLPIAVAIAVTLLPRLRALEVILLAVSFHLATAVINPEGGVTRVLDVVVTGLSVILGLLAARPMPWLTLGSGHSGHAQVTRPAPVTAALPAVVSRSAPGVVAVVPGQFTTADGPVRAGAWRGDTGLSLRQQEVAQLVVQGLTARQIGTRLFISERTVETHLANVYERLGVHSRLELRRSMSQPAIA